MDRELTEGERIEREEFARGHIGPGEDPVEPRPAATLVLARPAAEGFRILLLRRPEEARFAAGAYVFPGGVIDPGDRAPGLAERFGPGVTGRERAALVAALRELFEETGLLPADGLPGAGELRRGRRALLRDETDLPGLVRRWDLRFRGLRAVYLARWITPEKLDRRYDTRFFLAEHRGGEPELVAEEHTEFLWLRPDEALARFEEGRLRMLFPTRRTVRDLSERDSLEEALRAYRGRRVEPVRPRLLVEGDRVVPLMPGDPRYPEAG